ncbi:MAG: valine--tRNA ligase [Candidatus Omnitrophica bacterium]|nr:valine--tRNA ligase [Candidatus Omnitrophota bacterium]MCF7894054.1 valine--tRNA ligase [Candidatus Omnitrophota bacterium]
MEIPTRYNPKETEKRILQEWLKSSTFHATKKTNKDPFSIVIPPPNITGILHMGHALNNTIQDVLVRYKRMRGYEALWMPGTDHAGIATQNVVERALAKEGKTKDDVGREEFQKRLWSWKDNYGSRIIDQLKKIGASCDWKRLRFTMDQAYSRAVGEVFLQLFNQDLIYRGNYIINWCPRCKTALSDEEAAHKEVDGWLYYLRYPVETKEGDKKYISVATTRPETMLGDTAVAINPKDKRYSWLKEAKVILPIAGRSLKIIEDKAVDPEFGTGVVKVTPAHDPVDFQLGKKHDLEFINIMNEDATLNQNVPENFQGLDRFEARAALVELLAQKKLIEKKEPYNLGAGHCYRCNTIVEPRISLQWFVKMKPLAQEAIKVVQQDKIKFYPRRWKKVYLNWMFNIQDWCISRQIWWGHRIPVWYCQDCYNPDSGDKKGIIAAKEKPEKCPDCGSQKLKQDPDVLDTWFSSWLWPFATFGWPFEKRGTRDEGRGTKEKKEEFEYFYPTNTLVTASEILFFWVARMIMASLKFTGKIPFSDVIIHGTVRDDKGIKMSKSLGNVIDPLEIIDKYGADALRFSLMFLAASGSDVFLSTDKFLMGRNFSNKIWNANRFIFSKIQDKKINIDKLEYSFEDESDAWILDKLNKTVANCSKAIEKHRIDEAIKKAYDFFWHSFCDWYLEIIKDNFNQEKANNSVFILISSLQLLHPFIPFITEEIFSLIKQNSSLPVTESISKSGWPKQQKIDINPESLVIFTKIIDSVDKIRDLRGDLGLGQEKISLEVKTNLGLREFWNRHKGWFSKLVAANNVNLVDNLERVFYQNKYWSINLKIDSANLDKFSQALDKKIDNFSSLIKKTEGKLKNENFIKNAPKNIIAKEKAKQSDFSKQLMRLKNLKEIIS